MLSFPEVQLLDVAGPLQVFATANRLLAAEGVAPPYATRVVAAREGIVTTSGGLALAAGPLPDRGSPLDTLMVAGGQGVADAAGDPALVEWLRARAGDARRVASVCTGAYMLAAAGLLDGRRAVTHWAHCDDLARCYPAVRVESDPIFVNDGMIWTSAGVTAGIDLALALVEGDLGRTVALEVARYLVVFLKRPGGQAQFSTALSLQSAGDKFDSLHGWISENLGREITVPVLASQAGMSERSLLRRYTRATGMSPTQAVERLRVEAARRLLSETALPVKRVAARCGFGSEETMRRSFLRQLGATPKDYRERFSI